MVDEAAPSQPAGRDYGWRLVVVIAALLLVGSVVLAVVDLSAEGLSLALVSRLCIGLALSCWIGMAAWRRTTWSSGHSAGPLAAHQPRRRGTDLGS
jgi:hypothetical protein